MSSSVWTNNSIPRTLVNAQAEFAPFGPNGLILLLGGTSGDSPTGLVNFVNVTFYDPITRQLFSQQATGTIPTGRQRFCSVGVPGPDNTFEVFLYGGLVADNTVSDEVFVLSLPGFVFVKADNPGATTARADHACVAVGAGKRQMLSIGGTDASKGYPAEFADPDPWAQGLGVFDMTGLRWTDGYANDAVAYDTPEVVKQFYRDGGLGKVQWASDEVENLFSSTTPGFNAGPGSGNPGGSTSDNKNNDNSNNNYNDNENNTNENNSDNPAGSGLTSGLSRSAILGISIGTTAALPMLIAALYFFCCRRRPTAASKFTAAIKEDQDQDQDQDQDHDRGLSDISKRPAARPNKSNKKGRLAIPSSPLARRSLEQYSVHIKGNATPIIIDSTALSTRTPNRGTAPPPQQPQQQQQQGPSARKPVRFSALLRPPQRKPVPALQPQQALGGNPVTIRSDLADRRGRPALQAIRTRTAATTAGAEDELAKGGGVRAYQAQPS
ncbi:putative kelch repeat protein [Diaporthe ampelina]|uniref:Putative kelch repeat protein n=1 Tax=Diaporthe ampelina TaxID=1214573 RepID=A0A0G2HNT7_9PEZI|nr:putative kelch repeat protein [Diaporthe ampelina]